MCPVSTGGGERAASSRSERAGALALFSTRACALGARARMSFAGKGGEEGGRADGLHLGGRTDGEDDFCVGVPVQKLLRTRRRCDSGSWAERGARYAEARQARCEQSDLVDEASREVCRRVVAVRGHVVDHALDRPGPLRTAPLSRACRMAKQARAPRRRAQVD